MGTIQAPLGQKIRTSLNGIGIVLRRPIYLAMAALSSIIFFEFIYWFNNIQLFQYIITSGLSPAAKIEFIANTYTNMWYSFTSILASSLLVISFIQGIIVSCLIFILRRQRQTTELAGTVGKSGLAGSLAVLSLGCATCGTSLIAPILGLFVSNVSAALVDTIGVAASLAGLLLSLYALYLIGLRTQGTAAMYKQNSLPY